MKKDYSKINVDFENITIEDLDLLRKGANLIIKYNDKKIKVRKVIQFHKEPNMVTKTELKKMKLEPDAPPIAWCFQKWLGTIFFYYDKTKVKPLVNIVSDEDKQKRKEYLKNLRKRKTCPLCNKVQKRLDDLEDYIIKESDNKKLNKIWCCESCYKHNKQY